jgi:16S rRNA (guanine966-N2)-methyltransferase
MRITGGERRGRRLASFQGSRIRPTSDKVRGAIFNLLGQDMTGFRVLDLFAGTGALGIESLSRGATEAFFVDCSPEALQLVRRNLSLCGYEGAGVLLRKDLSRGIPFEQFPVESGFDLVFADPPYRKGLLLPVLQGLSGMGILSSTGAFVAESSREETLPENAGRLSLAKDRVYGDTRVFIYTSETEAEHE